MINKIKQFIFFALCVIAINIFPNAHCEDISHAENANSNIKRTTCKHCESCHNEDNKSYVSLSKSINISKLKLTQPTPVIKYNLITDVTWIFNNKYANTSQKQDLPHYILTSSLLL
jgi:hypothetical protein